MSKILRRLELHGSGLSIFAATNLHGSMGHPSVQHGAMYHAMHWENGVLQRIKSLASYVDLSFRSALWIPLYSLCTKPNL
jgi:hypothetical protein